MQLDAGIFRDMLTVVLNINNDTSKQLFEKLNSVYEEQISIISPSDSKYIKVYLGLIRDAIDQVLCIEYNRGAIIGLMNKYLQHPNFRRDKLFEESLLGICTDKSSIKQLVDLASNIRVTLALYCANTNINQLYGAVKEASNKSNSADRLIAIETLKNKVSAFNSEFVEATSTVGRGGPVEVINFTDTASIDKAIEENREISKVGVIKSGLIMMNQMLGEPGGFKRGDSHVFAARLHNFKSGMLLKVIQWHLLHNKAKPPAENDGRKQAIIFISLENTCHQNMVKMFREMYFNLTGVDGTKLADADIQKYVHDIFNQSGYSVFMERHLASTFGYAELVTLIETYTAAGYEIVSLCVDYLTKMKKDAGIYSKEGSHAHVRMLFEQVCDYCKALSIAMFTGAQLNRKASGIVASCAGKANVVKQFDDDMIAESLDIPRVVDFLAYINVEKDGRGDKWLTVFWGKHRYVENTPERHKYFCYKFDPLGGIVDDLEGGCTGIRDLSRVNDGAEKAAVSGDIEDLLCS